MIKRLPVFLVFCGIVLAFLGHTYFLHLDLAIAVNGFSVLELLQSHSNPENFVRDFPGGSRVTTGNTLTTWLYFFLNGKLNIDALLLNYGMIFLEISTLVVGSLVFWQYKEHGN